VADGGGVKDGCGDCGGRRAAVGRISAAALAALAGVTLPPGSAGAYPVVEATGTAAGGEERRFPLPASDGVTIDREAQVILVRYQDRIYAFNLACPHENTALRWRARDVRFQCPRHESQYEPDGTFIRGRATRSMDRFAVRREGGDLVIDLGRLYRSDESPREWAAAFVPA
jgi:nitrite reductase/ring-hydroxylating ferredoxin subunit